MLIYNQNIWGNTREIIGNRNLLVRELIAEINPDICCFQECNPQTSRCGKTPMQELMKPKYIEVLPEYADRNFTPVFYNSEKLRLLECEYFPFEGLNDLDSKSITWGMFEEKSTGKRIIVMSVHFWWMYESEADNLQRCKNAETVCSLAKKLYNQYETAVIVTGDLNSGDKSRQGNGGYNKMIELGMKDIRYIAKETDDADTVSDTYPKANENGEYENGVMPEYTIDYAFAYGDESIFANKFSVINTQKARNSSDHSPLVIQFDIK